MIVPVLYYTILRIAEDELEDYFTQNIYKVHRNTQ